jgi:hypothetical protein
MLYREIIAVLMPIQNTSIDFVGRAKNFLMLNPILRKATTGFCSVKGTRKFLSFFTEMLFRY